VSERCLRRIGVWRLVSQCTKNPLPVVPVRHHANVVAAPVPRSVAPQQVHSPCLPIMGNDPPLVCVEACDELFLERIAQDPVGGPIVEQVPRDFPRRHIDLSSKVEEVRNDMQLRLADWAISHNITRSAFTSLLSLCNSVLPSLQLPKAAATVLSVSIQVLPLASIHFVYIHSLGIFISGSSWYFFRNQTPTPRSNYSRTESKNFMQERVLPIPWYTRRTHWHLPWCVVKVILNLLSMSSHFRCLRICVWSFIQVCITVSIISA
jgi:hypothetical protein